MGGGIDTVWNGIGGRDGMEWTRGETDLVVKRVSVIVVCRLAHYTVVAHEILKLVFFVRGAFFSGEYNCSGIHGDFDFFVAQAPGLCCLVRGVLQGPRSEHGEVLRPPRFTPVVLAVPDERIPHELSCCDTILHFIPGEQRRRFRPIGVVGSIVAVERTVVDESLRIGTFQSEFNAMVLHGTQWDRPTVTFGEPERRFDVQAGLLHAGRATFLFAIVVPGQSTSAVVLLIVQAVQHVHEFPSQLIDLDTSNIHLQFLYESVAHAIAPGRLAKRVTRECCIIVGVGSLVFTGQNSKTTKAEGLDVHIDILEYLATGLTVTCRHLQTQYFVPNVTSHV